MPKSSNIIKYNGHVYVATDISVRPKPPGSTLVAERDYEDDVRGVYRSGNGYYGMVKLKWQQSGEVDELTFPIDTYTAWTMLVYIMQDGDPRKVKVDENELQELQLKSLPGGEPDQPSIPRGDVIDIKGSFNDLSGHYVRVADVPVYHPDFVDEATPIRAEASTQDSTDFIQRLLARLDAK